MVDLLTGDEFDKPQFFNISYLKQQIPSGLPQKQLEKIDRVLEIINQPIIDIQMLRKQCYYGISDECRGLRAICWKLLLGYLPPDKKKWDSYLKEKQETYQLFQQEFLGKVNPPSEEEHKDYDILRNNYPSYLQDFEVYEQIEKDTVRTRSELHFFVSDINFPDVYTRIPFITQTQLQNKQKEKHYDSLSRILYIYAKLNPGIKYVQGMNEILAPIYYSFTQDPNPVFQPHIESDAFFCFTTLLADHKECFIKQMDFIDGGIIDRLLVFERMLEVVDPDIHQQLKSLGVMAHFYAFKWIMLLLCQDFELFDVLRVWDSLFSIENRVKFLYYLCLGVVEVKREQIDGQEFAKILESLQRLEDVDILSMIHYAGQIKQKYDGMFTAAWMSNENNKQ